MRRKIIIALIVIAALATLGVASTAFILSGDSVERHMELANKYMSDGKYEEAIIAFEKVLDVDAHNIDARMGIAEAYYDLEEYEAAENYLQEVIEEDAAYDKAYVLLAECMEAEGRYKEAIALLSDRGQYSSNRKLHRLLDRLIQDYKPLLPEVSLASGTYDGDILLEVVALGGEDIHYTLDGSDPDSESALYSDAIFLDRSTEVRLIAANEYDVTSDVLSYQYTIKKVIQLDINQIDSKDFPEVKLYAQILNKEGEVVEGINADYLEVDESSENGIKRYEINELYKLETSDDIVMNLVLDTSVSMEEGNRIIQAKTAAKEFLGGVDFASGHMVELISFNDYVYLNQTFTDDYYKLVSAIDNMYLDGRTALYDALYSALIQTHAQTGSKCVIAFTDGMENASSYSINDVILLSQKTGIPVYIIGIGDGIDESELRKIATGCSGEYYSATNVDLDSLLEEIYGQIYESYRDMYVISYTSEGIGQLDETRTIRLITSESSSFVGETVKEYVPVPEINAGFSAVYFSNDYILPYSETKAVSESDLHNLSLAELRLARNEIFARHGRQFNDSLLNQWFYAKAWYLNITRKYAPSVFDSLSPYPLTAVEIANVKVIIAYENNLISAGNIYPFIDTMLLSEYDLYLKKEVLRSALDEIEVDRDNAILMANIQMIEEAIAKEDIQY